MQPSDVPVQLESFEIEIVSCLCGATRDDRTREARCDVTGLTFTYVRCAACGLERLSPRPQIHEMGRFYPDAYTPYADKVPGSASTETRIKRLVYEIYYAAPAERSATTARWRWALRVLLWPMRNHSVLSFPPPATRHVFEFGAGSGNDLLEFRAAGWTVGGCEPSAHACCVAGRLGITLQNCTAEAAELPHGTSCIYMNNVFEHLHDPIGVLAKARPSLASDALVVLVVPNHGSIASRLFGAAWPGYDPPKHIWGYTRASLPGIMAQAGYETIAIDQKFPFSTYCWATGIIGNRLPDPPGGTWRPRLVRLLGRSLVLAGMVSALLGGGDYLRVLARPKT